MGTRDGIKRSPCMASKRPLKVFRTSAGFEDAYIAAPSQKAALEAWGAKRNLFALGAAEVVKDQDLAKAALARPGEVLRVPRGTTAEHLAAVGRGRVPKGKPEALEGKGQALPVKPAKPKPSRTKLEAERRRLEDRRSDLEARQAELDQRMEALKAELARFKVQSGKELAKLEAQVKAEEAAYRRALAAWEG